VENEVNFTVQQYHFDTDGRRARHPCTVRSSRLVIAGMMHTE
jgi:hypothetical protein